MNRYGHILKDAALKIAALLLLYSLTRIVFYGCNHSNFPDAGISHFLAGLRFDLSAIAYLNLPWLFIALLPLPFLWKKGWQTAFSIIYVIINSLALLANLVDTAYFPYVSKRLTADIFSYIGHARFDFSTLLPISAAWGWQCAPRVRRVNSALWGRSSRGAVNRRDTE